ncbi:hypothetical protein P3T37_002105 [Kitasatospora sp. MAA4]|uniref:hypothetical protein n=1 Tax=Kitasatospora sp. MAA4 TaxID=3035093 RepID=UPI002475C99E|nr:hypothetical protein [Kitasatospora sp. MAA4]MDH6132719.1 hypothetical protein [Kitasatospora sp. MAA4]
MTEDQHGSRGRAGSPGGAEERVGFEAQVSAEEQALRALLHRAVDGLQPAPDALPRIRRAVPVRRVRRRQAWTSAALAAAVLAVAVPTLQSLGALQLSDGSAAGSGTARPTEESGSPGPASKRWHPLPGLPRTGLPDEDDATAASSVSPSAGITDLTGAAGGPAGTGAAAPDCGSTDLGHGSALVGTPDAAGRRYGFFTVSNVSGRACLLTDPGTLTVGGAAGPVTVVLHTPGDPAAALPDPATLPSRLLLAVAGSYQLSFAWVPNTLCPVGGGSSSAVPSADPSPSATPGGGAGSSGGSPGTGAPGATGSPGAAGAAGDRADAPSGQAGAAPAADPGGPGSTDTSPGDGPPAPTSGSAAARSSPGTSPSASAAQPSGPAGASGTLTVGDRPIGGGPQAAAAQLDGVCGGGTVYRSLPQPVS